MRINNNLMALNTHRQYSVNNENVSKSVEKLSSGYRINRAGDDAAGLAISEKMRAQIRGLNMASKNSQDAISLVQTAEGALQESHNILQRMRELAVQSASDSNETTIDRDALNKEFQAMLQEIDDTASKAKFNDLGLIDGTFAGEGITTITLRGNMPAGVTFDASGITAKDGDAIDIDVVVTAAVPPAEGTLTIDGTTVKNGDSTINGTTTTGLKINLGGPVDLSKLSATSFGGNGTWKLTASVIKGTDFVVQTGANEGDTLKINIASMGVVSLGLSGIHVADRANASSSITKVNDAINRVSSQRADLGALQNRMEHKISNLDTSAENLQAAESRIRDLDMAKEMTNFTKQNILSQASTAMLAQANALPQGVLQLLQG